MVGILLSHNFNFGMKVEENSKNIDSIELIREYKLNDTIWNESRHFLFTNNFRKTILYFFIFCKFYFHSFNWKIIPKSIIIYIISNYPQFILLEKILTKLSIKRKLKKIK